MYKIKIYSHLSTFIPPFPDSPDVVRRPSGDPGPLTLDVPVFRNNMPETVYYTVWRVFDIIYIYTKLYEVRGGVNFFNGNLARFIVLSFEFCRLKPKNVILLFYFSFYDIAYNVYSIHV